MTPAVDKEGFLRDFREWTPQAAENIAAAEGITLTDEHWCVIDAVRNYYDRYHLSPVTRVLVKITGEAIGEDKGRSIDVMRLFTGKPAKIAAKIAGLPKPPNCD